MKNRIMKLLRENSDSAGAIGGAAIGFLTQTGPIGAAASGQFIKNVLNSTCDEISARQLSEREVIRTAITIEKASELIQARLQNGDEPRDDGFFDEDESGRSDAKAIVESILLKCQREAEEKKIPYMANLLEAITFSENISTEHAHQVIKVAESLTYRQLCILSLSGNYNRFPLRNVSYSNCSKMDLPLEEVLHEIYQLHTSGLVKFMSKKSNERIQHGVLDVRHMIPQYMVASGLGEEILLKMRLDHSLSKSEDAKVVVDRLTDFLLNDRIKMKYPDKWQIIESKIIKCHFDFSDNKKLLLEHGTTLTTITLPRVINKDTFIDELENDSRVLDHLLSVINKSAAST